MGILPVKTIAITLVSVLCMCCCGTQPGNKNGKILAAGPVQGDSLQLSVGINIFSNDSMPGYEKTGGYGYDIFIGESRYIRQHSIPALPGNSGFSSREKALKTASLVARKILQHTLQPSVTLAELDSMGVLK